MRPVPPEILAEFLEALRREGRVERACELAGVARDTVYRRRAIEEFRRAWDDALREFDRITASKRSRRVRGRQRSEVPYGMSA